MVGIRFLVYLKAAENTSMIELLLLPDEESLPLLISIHPGLHCGYDYF